MSAEEQNMPTSIAEEPEAVTISSSVQEESVPQTSEATPDLENEEQPVEFDDLFPDEGQEEAVAEEEQPHEKQAPAGSAEQPEWKKAKEAQDAARAKAPDVDGAKATEIVPAANELVAEETVELEDLDWLNDEEDENYTFEDLFPEMEEEFALEDGKAPALALQDEGEGGSQAEEKEAEPAKNAFEEGLIRLKRKRVNQEMTPEEATEKMEDLICKMTTAADEDCELIRKNMAKERLRKMCYLAQKDLDAKKRLKTPEKKQKLEKDLGYFYKIVKEKKGKDGKVLKDENGKKLYERNYERLRKLYKFAGFPNGKQEFDNLLTEEDGKTKIDDQKAISVTLKLLDEHKEEPALQKVSILRQCVSEMSKPDNQNWFVTFGGLSVIRTWLAPSPDGSLPALTLRNELLRVLQKLPVNQENLRKSKLGHEINHLKKRQDETLQNRKICQDLISRWLSMALDVQNSIRTQRVRQQDELENSAKPVKKKRKTRAEQIAHDKEVQERRHPQMFQKPSHSFKVAPQFDVQSLASGAAERRQTRKGKIAKCAGELRALRPSEKHEHVSIANFQNRFS